MFDEVTCDVAYIAESCNALTLLYEVCAFVYVGPENITMGCFISVQIRTNGRGKPTASVLLADEFSLMAGPNFQPSDGNSTVISILQQLADGPENIPKM